MPHARLPDLHSPSGAIVHMAEWGDSDEGDSQDSFLSFRGSIGSGGAGEFGENAPAAASVGNKLKYEVAYEAQGSLVWKHFDREDLFAMAGAMALADNSEAPTETNVFDLLLQGARQHAVKLTGLPLSPGQLFILRKGKPRATTVAGIKKVESVLAEEDNLWEHVHNGILYMRYSAAESPSGRKRGAPDVPSASASTSGATASVSSARAVSAAAPPASASSASASAAAPPASSSPHTTGAAQKRPRAAGNPDDGCPRSSATVGGSYFSTACCRAVVVMLHAPVLCFLLIVCIFVGMSATVLLPAGILYMYMYM